jgi:hypothetical protein
MTFAWTSPTSHQDLSAWSYRKKITIDNTKVDADLTNFPVLITEANFDSTFFSNCESDGSDIVLTTDEGERLSRELVSIDTNGETMELWVKVPTVSSSTDTVIYIYYGNSSASETNDTDVWDSDFVGVWHMDDALTDSTSNGNNGTKHGLSQFPTEATGKIGKAQSFSNTNGEYIDVGSDSSLNPMGAITLECWAKIDIRSCNDGLISRGGLGNSWGSYQMCLYDEDIWASLNDHAAASRANTDLPSGESNWHHYMATYDRTLPSANVRIYIDGTLEGWCTGAYTTLLDYDDETDKTYLGNFYGDLGYQLDGSLDEVRISKTVRQATWIRTQYNNQNSPSTFYSVANIDVAWYNTSWLKRTKITVDNTKVAGDLTDFPVLITEANMESSFFDNCESDGADIVLTEDDGETKLKRELVSIDAGAETMELWVKIPSLSGSSDTVIYLYYDNSNGAETNDTDVWDSNFACVFHMDDDGSGDVADSTANGLDGVGSGSPSEVTGKIGKAMDVNGISDYFTAPYSSVYGSGAYSFTLECWIKADNAQESADHHVLHKRFPARLCYDENNSRAKGGFMARMENDTWYYSGGNSISHAVWHYFAGRYNYSTHIVDSWIDDTQGASNDIETSRSPDPNTEPFTIGNKKGGLRGFAGLIDEVRYSATFRSDDWLETCYNNQNSPSTFYSAIDDTPSWAGQANTYDDDLTTYACTADVDYLELYLDYAMICSKVRILAAANGENINEQTDTVNIDARINNVWETIYSGQFYNGVWNVFPIHDNDNADLVSAIRLNFPSSDSLMLVYEVDFYCKSYVAEPMPTAILKSQLEGIWDTSVDRIPEPTIIDLNQSDDEVSRFNFKDTDYVVIRTAPQGETEIWHGNCLYFSKAFNVVLDIYTAKSRQRLYDLKQEISRIIRAEKEDADTNKYDHLVYSGFTESNLEELKVWKGTMKMSFESHGKHMWQ